VPSRSDLKHSVRDLPLGSDQVFVAGFDTASASSGDPRPRQLTIEKSGLPIRSRQNCE
jgi:hypothetical protein